MPWNCNMAARLMKKNFWTIYFTAQLSRSSWILVKIKWLIYNWLQLIILEKIMDPLKCFNQWWTQTRCQYLGINKLTFVLVHPTVTVLLPVTPPGQRNALTAVSTLPLVFPALRWWRHAVLDTHETKFHTLFLNSLIKPFLFDQQSFSMYHQNMINVHEARKRLLQHLPLLFTYNLLHSDCSFFFTFSSDPSLQSSSPSQSHSFCRHKWLCGHRSWGGQRGGLVQSTSSERSLQSAKPSHLRASDTHWPLAQRYWLIVQATKPGKDLTILKTSKN